MVGQGLLQDSLSMWKPIQVLPPPSPHHHLRQAHWLRGCLSETVNPPSPPAFFLLLASFSASAPWPTVQLVVNRAFLDYFVIDVAIILFNGKGFMIFTWRNFFSLYYYYFLQIFFVYLFSLCIYFLHYLRLPKNSRAYNDVLRVTNCATILKRNASFETYNPRRLWRVMILSETHRGPDRLSLSVIWSEDPSEAMAVLNAWRK